MVDAQIVHASPDVITLFVQILKLQLQRSTQYGGYDTGLVVARVGSETGSVENKPSPGGPSKLTSRAKRMIVRSATNKPMTSAQNIANELMSSCNASVPAQTVCLWFSFPLGLFLCQEIYTRHVGKDMESQAMSGFSLDQWLLHSWLDDVQVACLLRKPKITGLIPAGVDRFSGSISYGYLAYESLIDRIDIDYAGQLLSSKTFQLQVPSPLTNPKSTRGLWAMDHVILNHGQVTCTSPELAPTSPNYHTTPTGGRLNSRQI
ncbi:hypothetical protein TNCV_3971991 [Trichonephila clavipes]|nr:hypothetical protein TNCV_3971991 [Trichonephila clavipes]